LSDACFCNASSFFLFTFCFYRVKATLMRKLAFFLFSVASLLGSLAPARAFDFAGFEHLVVFGDSLSDNGNLLALDPSFFLPPTPPYYKGRFSNGPNWVDYFPSVAPSVAHFGPITAFFAAHQPNHHPTDFAIGGATSAELNVQINDYLASLGQQRAPGDLCVIWIGADDFAAGLTAGSLDPRATVENIRAAIAQLSGVGVRTFIVITIPDIALTPQVKADPTIVQAATQFVFTTNTLLQVELLPYAWLQRVSIEIVDINRIFIPLVLNPGRFGFTNSAGFALDPSTGGGDTNANDYVFWDGFHPTTRVHQIAAEFIFREIASRRVFAGLLPVASRGSEAVSP
jgi:outer membrane lipase/esterase